MKKIGISCWMLFFLMIASLVLRAQNTKVGPWEKAREKDGIVLYLRDNPRSSIKEWRCVGMVEGSLPVCENILRDTNNIKKMMFMAKSIAPIDLPGYTNTTDLLYCHYLQGLPWPLQDRDGIVRMGYYIDKSSNQILIHCRVIPSEYAKTPGAVRMPYAETEIILIPVDASRTTIIYQLVADPGLTLPKWATSFVLKHLGINSIENFRNMAKDYKSNATTAVTKAEWPADLRHYAGDPK